MSLEPKNGIRLSDALQREVDELSRRTGEEPLAVLGKALELLKISLPPRNGEDAEEKGTVYDRWRKAGWIGCVEGGFPSDLSTSPKHMEGFGRD